ncbi:uncharacterized protein LOC132560228 [Ylistrum balloti]|uniref:uncharacterized protein LOC132560228 n=1 Tax=Ylistrum balloti TaxID=509963 RepID=UPI002905C540|nr:uncharacterized protein LOC132560228 [Ylistrum balloti]
MITWNVGVWIHVHFAVLCVISGNVLAENSFHVIAPSSIYSAHVLPLSTQASTAIGMSTHALEVSSTRTLVTDLAAVDVSSSVIQDDSSIVTIQPTATISNRNDGLSSSAPIIASSTSPGHPILTSSMPVGILMASVTSVREQPSVVSTTIVATPGGSSQVMSPSSASTLSASVVSSIDDLMVTPSLTNHTVTNTPIAAGQSSNILTPALSSATSLVSETAIGHSVSTLASVYTSIISSAVAPSSSLSLSSSSAIDSIGVSSAIVQSSSNITVEQSLSESVTPKPSKIFSTFVPITLNILSKINISPTSMVHFQSSSSHMSSVVSSLKSLSTTQGMLHIQTTRTKQETASMLPDYLMTSHTTSEFITLSSSYKESSKSGVIQILHTISLPATSSSVDRMTITSSRQEQVTPSLASVPTIATMATMTHKTPVTDRTTSAQRASLILMSTPSSSLQSSVVSSRVQPSTSVITPSQSATPEHSTSLSPEHSITTWLPPVMARNISFEIQFNGVCNPLVQRKTALEIFWEELVITLAKTLHIDHSDIKPKDIACRPIRISFIITSTTSKNITEILKTLVADRKLKFQIPVPVERTGSKYQYEAVSVKRVPLDYDISGTPDLYEIGLNKVDIIVIIVACCVSFILICIGCCICLREYYIRKRSRSFDLSDIVNFNLKLEDYTLTKIPRNKPFYSDNAVKMQSFTRKNGQQAKSLLEQEERCNCDDVNVMKEVKVRMNSHSDGIVIGVTATSIPDVVTNHQIQHDGQTDESKEILFENESSPTHCMDNPIYFADDDRFTAV